MKIPDTDPKNLHTHAGTDATLGDSELCGDEDPDTAMDAYSWKCRLPKNHSGSHISTSGKKWENENVTQGGVPSDLDRDVLTYLSSSFRDGAELEQLIDRLIAERKALREEVERLHRHKREWREGFLDLQAENAKLCAWQAAAAEERIELRERLNEAGKLAEKILDMERDLAYAPDDWVLTDSAVPLLNSLCDAARKLQAVLTEQQEPG